MYSYVATPFRDYEPIVPIIQGIINARIVAWATCLARKHLLIERLHIYGLSLVGFLYPILYIVDF